MQPTSSLNFVRGGETTIKDTVTCLQTLISLPHVQAVFTNFSTISTSPHMFEAWGNVLDGVEPEMLSNLRTLVLYSAEYCGRLHDPARFEDWTEEDIKLGIGKERVSLRSNMEIALNDHRSGVQTGAINLRLESAC